MKRTALLCLLVLLVNLLFAGGIYTNLEEAKEEAEYYGQAILMVFSQSDKSKPCIRLQQQVFNDPKFEAFAEANIVMCHIDLPENKDAQSEEQQRHNAEMVELYNTVEAFPKLLLMNDLGEVIATIDHIQIDTDAIIAAISAHLPQ